MLRYSSALHDEAMNVNSSSGMRAIPSMYFRPPSPHRSRASTSHPAMPPIPIQLQVPSMRSSASGAASYRSEKLEREREREKDREREREKKVPMAPAMRRGESSSTSSSSGSSRYAPSASYYRQDPPVHRERRTSMSSPTTATATTAPGSSSSSSRTRSRRQSISGTQGSNPYPATSRRVSDKFGDSPGSNAHTHTRPAESIPHLREALSSLESQMANLQFERQKLETRLEHAVRQQSPVHRLPRELLGQIFEIGVHRAEAEDAVLLSTLMRVCKTWTDVALNTPVLWSRILIDSPASLPKARRKLARSRAVPLDITIQFGPSVEYYEAVSTASASANASMMSPTLPVRGGQGGHGQAVIETVVHAMDLLQPALWRWRSFRLAVPTHAHAAAALSQCTEAAPLLEVLAVQVHHVLQDSLGRRSSSRARAAPLSLNAFMDEDEDDAGTQLFGGETPRLRKCSLTSFDAGWGGPLMRGLTVLRLGGFWNGAAPGVRTLVDVLRRCPMLEELALRNMSDVEGGIGIGNEGCACFDFDGSSKSSRHSHHSHSHGHSHSHSHSVYPRESDMIHLPRLKSASFYYSGQVRTAGLLSQMSFPALERLELSYLDNLTPVLTHLKRQACSPPTGLPLKALRIESCLFNELKLVRLLRRLPTLRTLELVDVEDVSASFLNGLSTPSQTHSQTHHSEWICPLLDTLSFDGCSALPWDALRALVESRLPPQDSAGARLLGPARTRTAGGSSASAYAAQQQRSGSSSASASSSASSSLSAGGKVSRASSDAQSTKGDYDSGMGMGMVPCRLSVLDLTRCPQISKEMVAWLRMYVAEVRVRREAEQTYWGEFGFAV